MSEEEVLKILSKVKNLSVRELVVNGFKSADKKTKKEIAKRLSSYKNSIENDLNHRAKAIAVYVRYCMEDFHVEHLSDKQMKELNPIIRNAIYTFLKDEADGNFFSMACLTALNLAPYWEDCEYVNVHETNGKFDEKEEEALIKLGEEYIL